MTTGLSKKSIAIETLHSIIPIIIIMTGKLGLDNPHSSPPFLHLRFYLPFSTLTSIVHSVGSSLTAHLSVTNEVGLEMDLLLLSFLCVTERQPGLLLPWLHTNSVSLRSAHLASILLPWHHHHIWLLLTTRLVVHWVGLRWCWYQYSIDQYHCSWLGLPSWNEPLLFPLVHFRVLGLCFLLSALCLFISLLLLIIYHTTAENSETATNREPEDKT